MWGRDGTKGGAGEVQGFNRFAQGGCCAVHVHCLDVTSTMACASLTTMHDCPNPRCFGLSQQGRFEPQQGTV